MLKTPPVSDIDLFSEGCLSDPYDSYEILRVLGPVVFLSCCNAFALTRYQVAKQALEDHDAFSAAKGVTLNAVMDSYQVGVTIQASDPPEHDRLRRVLHSALMAERLSILESKIDVIADQTVKSLVQQEQFDAISDLARAVTQNAIYDLLGLPQTGRHRLAAFTDAHFNAYGPLTNTIEKTARERVNNGLAAMQKGQSLLGYFINRLEPGSVGAAIKDAVTQGVITDFEADKLLSTLIVASVDTTVHSIGNAIYCLATHRDQWEMLRANPSLVPAAYNEALRFDSPSQIIARTTKRAFVVDGYSLPVDAKVAILFGSANHDEAVFDNSRDFRIDRPMSRPLSFGSGVHACIGQRLARRLGRAVIAALVRHARLIVLSEPPERQLNSVLRGFSKLPIKTVSVDAILPPRLACPLPATMATP
ncbi:cytochrome P450 [Xanthomonas albilineans]|uniref:Putative oxidoreductase cytochrome p-450 protein n=1 Tax=Xanthomonas albilineans (strain GPE PC73 / CFBP 7063) TaxID=380358 RepID=D2UE95_XANAP|nr:cytochrome P450 [Xanthomonas albilineans]CBA16341.1 putative oxidoreductase cytochrome p-450 protein [Xanthomonas albilineans GPE PC73]